VPICGSFLGYGTSSERYHAIRVPSVLYKFWWLRGGCSYRDHMRGLQFQGKARSLRKFLGLLHRKRASSRNLLMANADEMRYLKRCRSSERRCVTCLFGLCSYHVQQLEIGVYTSTTSSRQRVF